MTKRIEERYLGEEEAQKAKMLKHLSDKHLSENDVANQRTGFASFDALKEISKKKIDHKNGAN